MTPDELRDLLDIPIFFWERLDTDVIAAAIDRVQWLSWSPRLHPREHEATVFMCQLLSVFESLEERCRSVGVAKDRLHAAFTTILFGLGFPDEELIPFVFDTCLGTCEAKALILKNEVDEWEPGMRSGSGWRNYFRLSAAGRMLAARAAEAKKPTTENRQGMVSRDKADITRVASGPKPPRLARRPRKPDGVAVAQAQEGEGREKDNSEDEVSKLERTTPPLDKNSGQWVNNKRAAGLEGVQAQTLAAYRTKGIQNSDHTLGRDKDGRVWRREGTPRAHPWYLRATLTAK